MFGSTFPSVLMELGSTFPQHFVGADGTGFHFSQHFAGIDGTGFHFSQHFTEADELGFTWVLTSTVYEILMCLAANYSRVGSLRPTKGLLCK